MSSRTFTHQTAARAAVPVFIGLTGVSGSGKTHSAFRLAAGMQEVYGGEVFMIDTEGGRALHYAPRKGEIAKPPNTFRFQHIPFVAPYGPNDYLAAFQHAVKNGAKVIIVDSMSHEHEGEGGHLEQHDTETERLAKLWKTGYDQASRSGWIKPKADRKKLIDQITHLGVSLILCFRARKKTADAVVNGKNKIVKLGWLPVGGEEYWYEMTMSALLYPKSGGVPTWAPDLKGEKDSIKLPGYLSGFMEKPVPLSEEIGRQLAVWGQGGESSIASPGPPVPEGDIVMVTNVQDEPKGVFAVHLRNLETDSTKLYRTQNADLAERARMAKEVEAPMLATSRVTGKNNLELLTLVPSDQAEDPQP